MTGLHIPDLEDLELGPIGLSPVIVRTHCQDQTGRMVANSVRQFKHGALTVCVFRQTGGLTVAVLDQDGNGVTVEPMFQADLVTLPDGTEIA